MLIAPTSNNQATCRLSQCIILLLFFGGIVLNTEQGSKKVPSSSPIQVDFLAEQVTFKACLPNGQGSEQVIL